jgi:hypothetical protein
VVQQLAAERIEVVLGWEAGSVMDMDADDESGVDVIITYASKQAPFAGPTTL